jgi:hypothetical protein
MGSDVLNIDLASQSFMRDPFPTLTRLREAGPVVRVRLPFLGDTRIATTHEAVKEKAVRRPLGQPAENARWPPGRR